ncbi:MAG: hypothetical protein R2853_04455 [Thermomicrobiales bacterium]
MALRTLPARERQRLDALIDRPLRTFRTGIARLTDSDLEHLRARLNTRLVGAHFARGAHGLARHQAGQELPLLERRLALVSAEQARLRRQQLRLVGPGAPGEHTPEPAPLLEEIDERQAA